MASVNVEIMGQNLLISGDADVEWVRSVARAVDEKSQSIKAKTRGVNSVDLAILTALNFAEELAQLRKVGDEVEQLRAEVAQLRPVRDELEQLRRDHRELLEQIDALNRRLAQSFEVRK
jgi:cell division protein ZapA